MTELDAMDGIDRMVAAGFVPPDLDRRVLFREWYRHLRDVTVADMDAAITRLAASRELRYWPTPAEFRGYLPRPVPTDTSCPRCHGSKWIDADPFTANGGLVYENVVIRCPDCGSPPPNTSHLAGKQTPMIEDELMQRAEEAADRRAKAGHPPVGIIRTQEEFLAKLGELKHRLIKPMPGPPTRKP